MATGQLVDTAGFSYGPKVAGVLKALTGGLPGTADSMFVRPVRFWHRLAYAAAGSLTFQFFNVAKTRFVTNFPQASQLPANYGLALQGITLMVDSGIDLAGARVAAGAQAVATTLAAFTLAEELRTIHNNGVVRFKVNDRDVIPETYGLTAFPAGKGVDVAAAASSTATAASVGVVANGSPFWANRQLMDSPFPIAGGQNIEFTVEYQSLLTLTGGGVITAEMVGLLISPAGG